MTLLPRLLISSNNIIANSSFNDAVRDNLLKLKLGGLWEYVNYHVMQLNLKDR